MKICSRCRKEKEDIEFDIHNNKIALDIYCRDCDSKRIRENALHRKYGITLKQYELMLKAQNGKCAICRQPETRKINDKITQLAVDHKHKPFKMRGLLCHKCNRVLGLLKDDIEILKQAQAYLEKYK